MKTQGTPHHFSTVKEFLRQVIAFLGMTTFPQRLAPVPVPLARGTISGRERLRPRDLSTGWLSVFLGFALLAAIPAWAGQRALPAGVPNIYDPEVQVHYQPVGVANLGDNSDLPIVLLMNTTGEQPPALLIGLDARNGTDTWSLVSDPIILIVVFADETTIQSVYVDTGFADQGKASGSYTTVEKGDLSALPGLLKAVRAAGKRTYI